MGNFDGGAGEVQVDLVADGILSAERAEFLTSVLSSLGLEFAISTESPNQNVDAKPNDLANRSSALETIDSKMPYFHELTSPEHWIAKEHFFAFAKNFSDFNIPPTSVGQAFNRLIDNFRVHHNLAMTEPYPSKKIVRQLREVQPVDGLIIKPRGEINYPPHRRTTGHPENAIIESYVINVGSFIATTKELERSEKPLSARDHFVLRLGEKLASQMRP